MKNQLIAVAIGGIFAGLTGCATTTLPASVPGAPAADPAGAPAAVATGAPAMSAEDEKAKAGGKHACTAKNGCGADEKDDKDGKKKGTTPMTMPMPMPMPK